MLLLGVFSARAAIPRAAAAGATAATGVATLRACCRIVARGVGKLRKIGARVRATPRDARRFTLHRGDSGFPSHRRLDVNVSERNGATQAASASRCLRVKILLLH